MSVESVVDNLKSVTAGATVGFCTMAFTSAVYAVGYLPPNWLGASHSISVLAGLAVCSYAAYKGGLATGAAVGGLVGFLASVEKLKLNSKDFRDGPFLLGCAGGIVGGFKAAAVVGSLITFDNDRNVSHFVPTEPEQAKILHTI